MDQIPRFSDSSTRLLIVDDEPVMLAFLEKFLSRQFEIRACSDSSNAREAIDGDFDPDLILVDLQMPEMDGFELIKFIRRNPAHAETPIMVLSGSDKSADRIACLQLGAADFLAKPFNPEELLVRLAKHASGRIPVNPTAHAHV